MAERCGFFNATNAANPDRVYDSSDFAAYFASFIGNGVFAKHSNQLRVAQQESPDMSVQVLGGQAWINGWWYDNTSALNLSIDPADGTLDRVDIIVVQFDLTKRKIKTIVRKGSPSAGATAPMLNRDDDLWELKLAEVNVSHGTVNITDGKITDTRSDTEVCGWVSGLIDQMDTTELFNQLQEATQDAVDAMNNALTDVWAGIKVWLLDNVYKVGYVWTSYVDESPSGIVGGTWTPITGVFPYFNAGTETGGSNSISHTHNAGSFTAAVVLDAGDSDYSYVRARGGNHWNSTYRYYFGSKVNVQSMSMTEGTEVVGTSGSTSIDNMPSYQSFYAWRRIE